MKQGRIIKLIGGIYTVMDDAKQLYQLKPRGVFRHLDISPKVGDFVDFDVTTIHEVHPRKNDLIRPPITNVNQAILINSAKEPDFSFHLLDRFLVVVEKAEITPIIVVSKIDLITEEELKTLKKQLTYYQSYYEVYFTSVYDADSVDLLKKLLKDKISVFAGQTGSGKSSLLNALDIHLKIETAEISKALGRGKHTTRHSELLTIHEGLVADTPGFSKLDFGSIEVDELGVLYPDFFAYSKDCKFRSCHHINEPGCAVKTAVKNHKILSLRYEHYQLIYDEIKNIKKKY